MISLEFLKQLTYHQRCAVAVSCYANLSRHQVQLLGPNDLWQTENEHMVLATCVPQRLWDGLQNILIPDELLFGTLMQYQRVRWWFDRLADEMGLPIRFSKVRTLAPDVLPPLESYLVWSPSGFLCKRRPLPNY